MSWPQQPQSGTYGGSAIPGNNSAMMFSSPMLRGLYLAMMMQMMGLNPAMFQTPPLPGAGAGSGDPTAGTAAGAPGTVVAPQPGALQAMAQAPAPGAPAPTTTAPLVQQQTYQDVGRER